LDGRAVARNGRLVSRLNGGPSFTGGIQTATVERAGPVRALVRMEGVHKADAPRRGRKARRRI
jgi:hypothetical protein